MKPKQKSVVEGSPAAYQVDNISGGEGKDVSAGDHAGALFLDPGLDTVDRVVAVAGEGFIVGRVLLGIVVGRGY